jgi:hypothetical protein
VEFSGHDAVIRGSATKRLLKNPEPTFPVAVPSADYDPNRVRQDHLADLSLDLEPKIKPQFIAGRARVA